MLYICHICQENCTASDQIYCREINPCNSLPLSRSNKGNSHQNHLLSPQSPWESGTLYTEQKAKNSVHGRAESKLCSTRTIICQFKSNTLTLTINLAQDGSSCASKSHKMFTKINTTELTQLHFLPVITLKCKMPSSLILCMLHDGC